MHPHTAESPGLPTLVMIPGTLCDARVFQRQKRALRGLADVRIVDFHALDHIQAWLPQLLRLLPQKFSVAGFSLGGLCPPAWQRAMLAAQPRADWLEIPRAGHFIPLEAASRLNHALAAWIRT